MTVFVASADLYRHLVAAASSSFADIAAVAAATAGASPEYSFQVAACRGNLRKAG